MNIHQVMGELATQRARERADFDARVLAVLRNRGEVSLAELLEPLRLVQHRQRVESALRRLARRGCVRWRDDEQRRRLYSVA